jgi:hypothetical protein
MINTIIPEHTTIMKRITLIASAIALLLLFIVKSANSQSNCLYAWYELNGNALDSSGHNYHGTLFGAIPTMDHLGIVNSALSFNGISDKVSLPQDFDFQQRSITAWVKPDSYPITGAWIYDSDHLGLQYGHTQIYVSNELGVNKICFAVGTNFYKLNTAIIGKWYHVGIVINASFVKYYVDGLLKDSLPNNNFLCSVTGDNFAKIGTTRINDRFFQGSIDDVRIYNCALSNTEVTQIFTGIITTTNKINELSQLIHIYPNPAKDIINIQGVANDIPLNIYNINGALVHSETFQNNSIDIRYLTSGMYFIKFSTEEGNVMEKFVKE